VSARDEKALNQLRKARRIATVLADAWDVEQGLGEEAWATAALVADGRLDPPSATVRAMVLEVLRDRATCAERDTDDRPGRTR
jgi:hypothetical protein